MDKKHGTQELYANSANPTNETISLFDGVSCLNGSDGFMNERGLKSLISGLEQEEKQREWNAKGKAIYPNLYL